MVWVISYHTSLVVTREAGDGSPRDPSPRAGGVAQISANLTSRA